MEVVNSNLLKYGNNYDSKMFYSTAPEGTGLLNLHCCVSKLLQRLEQQILVW